MEFIYTLIFIKKNNQILLLNRDKKPWLGSWNGLGGKRNENESPLDCIIREVKEEANILLNKNDVIDKGYLTWDNFNALGQGLHLFFYELKEEFKQQFPIRVSEGILDTKSVDWIINKDNTGVAWNIKEFILPLINDTNRYHYHCIFKENDLMTLTKEVI